MLFTLLLVVQALVAAALVGVILVQRSEGGGLGMGGSPSGLMSARGAADFLTRLTTILAAVFVLLSVTLAGLATRAHAPDTIDTSLAHPQTQLPVAGHPVAPAPAGPAAPATAPATGVPIGR